MGESELYLELWQKHLPLAYDRLERQFAPVLDVHDLEDAVALGLMRAWTYRDRYDATKSSPQTWLYLLARSAALDLLRAKNRHLNLLRAYAREHAGRNDDGGSTGTPSPLTRALAQRLELLSELDRTILLAFAQDQGEGNWAARLAAHLGVPAATIRVRKLRLMERLRSELTDVNPNSSGGSKMSHDSPEQETVAQFRHFVRTHRTDMLRALELSKKARDRAADPENAQPENELTTMKRVWNQSIADGSIHDQTRRAHLETAMEWVRSIHESRAAYEQDAATVWERFSQESPIHLEESVQPSAGNAQNLQRCLAALSQSLIGHLPDRLIDQGKAVGKIDWRTEKAQFQWNDRDATVVPLADITQRTLAVYSGLNPTDSQRMSHFLLEGIRNGTVAIPKLQRLENSNDQETRVEWALTAAPPGIERPRFLGEPKAFALPPPNLPTNEELELWQRFTPLADQMDKAFCQAARTDAQRDQEIGLERTETIESRPMVDRLVDVLVEETGQPDPAKRFVLSFLSAQQEKDRGSQEPSPDLGESLRRLTQAFTEEESEREGSSEN